jgi:hypothetical protein
VPYTPKEDGDWLNVADVVSFKKNITLEFVKFGDWIGASWFRMIGMRRNAVLYRPAEAVYEIIKVKSGGNPSLQYGCVDQNFNLDFGKASDNIGNTNKDTAHVTWRFDGEKHHSELWYQNDLRKTKGINPATGEFREPPKGVPKEYTREDVNSLDEYSPNHPQRDINTARTIEISVVDNPKEPKEGLYARWDLPKSMKEMKESGELDRACKALMDADYITIGIEKQQFKAEKKAEVLKAKQDKVKAQEKDNAKKKD